MSVHGKSLLNAPLLCALCSSAPQEMEELYYTAEPQKLARRMLATLRGSGRGRALRWLLRLLAAHALEGRAASGRRGTEERNLAMLLAPCLRQAPSSAPAAPAAVPPGTRRERRKSRKAGAEAGAAAHGAGDDAERRHQLVVRFLEHAIRASAEHGASSRGAFQP